MNKFNKLNPQEENTKERKVSVYGNASEPYNEYLEIYFDQCMTLSNARKKDLGNKCNSINLFLETYNYDG